MVEQGDYGPVLILRGRYQGKVGYYDDDDDGEVLSKGVDRGACRVAQESVGCRRVSGGCSWWGVRAGRGQQDREGQQCPRPARRGSAPFPRTARGPARS